MPIPAARAERLVYQPIKSVASAKLSRAALLFPVLVLYSSHVPSSACEKPRALEGRLPLRRPKVRRCPRAGRAFLSKLDSALMIAICNGIDVPQVFCALAADRYQFLRSSKIWQISVCWSAFGGVVAHAVRTQTRPVSKAERTDDIYVLCHKRCCFCKTRCMTIGLG